MATPHEKKIEQGYTILPRQRRCADCLYLEVIYGTMEDDNELDYITFNCGINWFEVKLNGTCNEFKYGEE
jgi:hypothetical protein